MKPACAGFADHDNGAPEPGKKGMTATKAERTGPSKRSDYKTFRTIQTRWMDNDIYGHMNNVVHYSLFDTAVNGWLVEAGLLDLKSSTQVGLVVETGCRYHAEMMFPDVITAGIRVARIGSSSVRYEVGLFRNAEETASAEGFFVHVYVDRETRRPRPLSESMRGTLAEIAS
jgi:acyl-CoA thioester hydrolase